VAEAANSRDELFGTERMIRALQGAEDGSPEEILDAVNAAVAEFAGSAPQFDDLTMLCLSYK
jgi:serine phosphatase RsbU (regulator of sigma subunit)